MVAALRRLTPFSIPIVITLVFFLPILAGCITLIYQTGSSWIDDLKALATAPGIWSAWNMSVWTSIASTLGTVAITLLIIANLSHTLHHKKFWWFLSPLVAMPHIAFALGLGFLLAPSGWFLKLLSPWLTGLERPAIWTLVQDSYGLALIFCLICKEVPFLLMMALSSLNWQQINTQLTTCQTLGYTRTQAMWKIIFPQILKQIRLPIYAIAAYGLSVVDLSLLLGPNTPPTSAVMIWQWSLKSDVLSQKWAAQSALILWATTAVVFLLCYGLEHLFCIKTRAWQLGGVRQNNHPIQARLSAFLLGGFAGLFLMTISVLLLWSFADYWRFPDSLPSEWTLDYWQESFRQTGPLLYMSFLLALTSSLFCLCLAVACLEYQHHKQQTWPVHLLCLPLFIPQVALLTGVQILWLQLGFFHGFFAVFWGHCLFVFPYVYLSLYGAYIAYDIRHTQTVLSLGKPFWIALFHVKWPLLAYPMGIACAVGFSVSMAQYLPTILLSGGRMSTVTTEAIVTGTSFDRQYAGIYAFWQLCLPALIYLIAHFWRRKKRMLYGAYSK